MSSLGRTLLADAEGFDDLDVFVAILGGEIGQEAMALADEAKKGAAGVGVLAVLLEMLGQILDPLGQDGDLDGAGAGVGGALPELLDEVGGLFLA